MSSSPNTTLEDFRAGVTACLRSWSALKAAVESGWGGGERISQEKADNLRTSILEIMNGQKCPIPNFDRQDLADNLAIYMEEEFSVTLEDNSEVQLADTLFLMYEECFRGDSTRARQIVAQAEMALSMHTQYPIQIQSTEHDDEDDEDMVDSNNDAPQIAAGQAGPLLGQIPEDYNSKPLFGEARKVTVSSAPVRQLGDSVPDEPEEVEMDDDGFAPVKSKNQRKRQGAR